MSEEKRMQVAKKYVDKQLKTMKRRGSAIRKISSYEYKSLIRQVAQAVQK
jgi:hypothetical protein